SKPVPRIDGPDIVSGRAVYGLDVRVPGMLFAAVARPPVAGGRIVRFDAAKATAVEGVVKVVPVPTGVAVLARNSHDAIRARAALAASAVFDAGPNASLTPAELGRRLDDPRPSGSRHALHRTRKQGDTAAALAAVPTRISASYRDAFQAHASVEPMNCTAR